MYSRKKNIQPSTRSLSALRQPWKVISFAATIALFSMQGAHAQEQGWYAGASAGVSHNSLSGSDVDGTLGNQGVTSSTSLDRHDNVYSLNLGYKFHKNLAVEAGYVDLGKYNFNSNVSAPATDTASGNYRIHGWTTSAVGILPLDNGFSAYGKLGAVFADTKFNVASDTGATTLNSASHSTVRPTYGLGLSYAFSKQIDGKVEWNRYQNVGDATTGKPDIDTYTVGVAYKF